MGAERDGGSGAEAKAGVHQKIHRGQLTCSLQFVFQSDIWPAMAPGMALGQDRLRLKRAIVESLTVVDFAFLLGSWTHWPGQAFLSRSYSKLEFITIPYLLDIFLRLDTWAFSGDSACKQLEHDPCL